MYGNMRSVSLKIGRAHLERRSRRRLGTEDGGVRKKAGVHHIPEWWWSYSGVYFHWKHFYPKWYFWKMICLRHFRWSVLRKANVFKPWRLPFGIMSYCYSVIKAYRQFTQRNVLRKERCTKASARPASHFRESP